MKKGSIALNCSFRTTLCFKHLQHLTGKPACPLVPGMPGGPTLPALALRPRLPRAPGGPAGHPHSLPGGPSGGGPGGNPAESFFVGRVTTSASRGGPSAPASDCSEVHHQL
jgi:hypothetical protein